MIVTMSDLERYIDGALAFGCSAHVDTKWVGNFMSIKRAVLNCTGRETESVEMDYQFRTMARKLPSLVTAAEIKTYIHDKEKR